MEVISLMEAKHGLPMPHSRAFTRYLFSSVLLTMYRDVFIVWAKCKWDGKIRGFILEKVQGNLFSYPEESTLTSCTREWTV